MYGGAISIMIGSYSWSSSFSGTSTAQSDHTYCSGCSVNVSDVAITNSVAVSNATTGHVGNLNGGSLSLVIGAYLLSNSQQYVSNCSAGVTVVYGLLMKLNYIRISGSLAATYTIGGASQPHNPATTRFACASDFD